ncbi:OPT/YSL family transporter [uncultured Parolsenella sp.]|uniref:OPT/YSL family transporter n=1 Tax=uncultured Parolsenella sp. TaxID=2083008 RepID=UPI0025E6E025|nr:OPT/YSL family transporter [uncultured Parolsenella sp.]
MSTSSDRAQACGQLSPVGIAIGVVGCVVITASSVYTALKMGSLPWPTIFTSITALVLLRAFGHRSLNEANITQIVMSAGSMVAGGLAFTIPGIWMLGLADHTSMAEMLFVALAGTLLGLVCTALIRRRFVAESDLEYPIGTAAAETLAATTSRGGTGKKLFLSMGIAGVYSVLRDVLGVVPQMLLALPIPGVTFGIYNSPMMLSVGFLVGFGALAFAMAGAVFANFGLVVGGTAAGLWDVATAGGIVKSLGMGLMMGSGLGVVLKDILPALVRMAQGRDDVHAGSGEGSGTASTGKDSGTASAGKGSAAAASGERGDLFGDLTGRYDAGVLALMVAASALVICLGLSLSPLVAVVIILLSFVTTIMSAQSVGQTGIDPMEIFGLIVLLIVAVISQTPPVKLFFVAGIVAVTCGLAGDVMSDFKTGAIIGTNPRAMWVGQAIGALLGVVVAAVTMSALFTAYGPDAFGVGKAFVAAQASVVATMVSGIPSVPAFVIGLAAGIGMYLVGLPSMMIGLGVYLPFYMPFSMFVGSVAKLVFDHFARKAGVDEQAERETGIVCASGLLGGESIVGVVIALVSVATGLAG